MPSNLELWAMTQGYDPLHDYTPEPELKPGYFSEHFSHNEFACKCSARGYGPLCNGWGLEVGVAISGDQITRLMDPRLFLNLEDIRAHFGGAPIHVNSGFRCPGHNERQGGAKESQHLKGKAADIWSPVTKPYVIYEYCNEKFADCGVGRYPSFTHIDTRGTAARW